MGSKSDSSKKIKKTDKSTNTTNPTTTKDSSNRKRKSNQNHETSQIEPSSISLPSKLEPTMEIGSDDEVISSSTSKGKQKAIAKNSSKLIREDDDTDVEGSEDDGPFPELFLSDDAEDEEDEEEDEEDDDDLSGSDLEDSLLFSDDVPDEELGSLLDDSSESDPNEDPENFISRSRTKIDEKEPELETFGRHSIDYMKRARTKPSKFVDGTSIQVWDDIVPGYGSESSTEDAPNRIGNIPAHFYDDMPHIGYDIDGKKIMRPAKGDELDKFLAGVEDPTAWTSVEDKLLHKNVQLTDAELELIHKLAKAENPDAEFDPYEPMVEFFTGKGKEMTMPLSAAPEPKRRFIPSKWEHKKVMKIVRAIRQGRIVPNKPKVEKPQFYALWSNDDTPRAPGPMYMPAPKLKLPGHIESYNPPAEYLFDEEEKKQWEEADPSDRKIDFLPAKHSSLRLVPGYNNFVQERFDRCLDLYLAPRMLRRRPKLDINDPSELLPKLPSPQDLRPFPSVCSIEYVHESGSKVRTVSIDPTGMWVATGSENGEILIWECKIGRCAMKWNMSGKENTPVYAVEWCPDRNKCILAAAVGNKVVMLSPLSVLSPSQATNAIEAAHAGFNTVSDATPIISDAKWTRASEKERDTGILIEIAVPGTPKQVTWHKRGDYFSTVSTEAINKSVLIHQLSKHQTQSPFKRTKGIVQKVIFHPIKPYLFVATQRFVRVYDLLSQTLIKTLQPGVRWISSIDVHPLGDNVIIGSYDKRLAWHDMDLGDRPYKTLRYHQKAIRSVGFSKRFPLFFTTSDDGTIQIFHSTVYSDLMMNPLIVPLKVLKGHLIKESLGVLQAFWHPSEPWIVSVGADGVGKLWCC